MGENTTIYSDGLHARSTTSQRHPSRSWVTSLQARLAGDIPAGWRICGENLFARHSIEYTTLQSYFYVFSIWDEHNICLSWDQTLEWAGLLDLPVVPELYRGEWQEDTIRAITMNTEKQEGYVVRYVHSFCYDDFSVNVAKWVRPNHVQTNSHWMKEKVVPNKLLG